MFSRIRHVAFVAIVALAAVTMTTQNSHAQLQLPQTVSDQVNAAMAAGNPTQVLALLRAVLDANPGLAGAIATAAGNANPALAASIGAQAAQAVSQSTALTPAQKAAQVQIAARGLAAANPDAAGDVLATITQSVTPDLQAAVAVVIAEQDVAAGDNTEQVVVEVVADEDFVPPETNENDIVGS